MCQLAGLTILGQLHSFLPSTGSAQALSTLPFVGLSPALQPCLPCFS